MIGIEDLKQRYPDVRDIKPYGFVVVVPGKEFDPDWEFQLEDQGYKVHLVELDRKPVALVSCVKKKPVEEGTAVDGNDWKRSRKALCPHCGAQVSFPRQEGVIEI